MANKRALKRRLYLSAVASAAALGLGAGDYLCPLCLSSFGESALESGDLTLEHVPPESQGGKGIILTCKGCNNRAGHHIESQAALRSKVGDFTRAVVGNQVGFGGIAFITIGGVKLNVDVLRDKDALNFKVSPHNSPSAMRAVDAALRQATVGENWRELKFDVTSRDAYHPRRAHVADLKAAFLVLAAAFGYSFAADEVMEPVRRQIADPDAFIMPQWWGQVPVQPMTIGLILDDGVAVVSFRNSSVVLPWPSRSDEHWKTILDGSPKMLKGIKWPWPRTFVGHADHSADVR